MGSDSICLLLLNLCLNNIVSYPLADGINAQCVLIGLA